MIFFSLPKEIQLIRDFWYQRNSSCLKILFIPLEASPKIAINIYSNLSSVRFESPQYELEPSLPLKEIIKNLVIPQT